MRELKDRSELYKSRQSLMLTSYILALICLVLEAVISVSDIRTKDFVNDFKWVFRWIILSNLLNGINQRYYTTEIDGEKRLASAVIKLQ